MINKTLICISQLQDNCSTVMAIIFKKVDWSWQSTWIKEFYYGKGIKGPFLQLKKSLRSLCALFSLQQLRSIFVYESLKKHRIVEMFGFLFCVLCPSPVRPEWGGVYTLAMGYVWHFGDLKTQSQCVCNCGSKAWIGELKRHVIHSHWPLKKSAKRLKPPCADRLTYMHTFCYLQYFYAYDLG